MQGEHTIEWVDYYPPEYPQLILGFGGVTLNLVNEEIFAFARTPISEKSIVRSHPGYTIVTDRCSTDKYQWDLTLNLGIFQADKLKAIYQKSNTKRKTPPRTGFEITLSDIAEPILEESIDRTNAVSGWTKTTEGMQKYFAVFSVLINQFSCVPNGLGYDCELQLVEV